MESTLNWNGSIGCSFISWRRRHKPRAPRDVAREETLEMDAWRVWRRDWWGGVRERAGYGGQHIGHSSATQPTPCLDMRHGQEWAYWAEVKTGMGQSLIGYEKRRRWPESKTEGRQNHLWKEEIICRLWGSIPHIKRQMIIEQHTHNRLEFTWLYRGVFCFVVLWHCYLSSQRLFSTQTYK